MTRLKAPSRNRPVRSLTHGLLLFACIPAPACSFETLWDLAAGEGSDDDGELKVWEVEGLVDKGITFIVEAEPGLEATAEIEPEGGGAKQEVSAMAGPDGRAVIEFVPDDPEPDASFTAWINVEGNDPGQLVRMSFEPKLMTAVGIEPAEGSSSKGGDTLTMHIACKDRFIVHPTAEIAVGDDGYAMQIFVPDAAKMAIDGTDYTFAPAKRSFTAIDADFNREPLELDVQAATVTIPKGGFAKHALASDLGEPTADIGPRFVITLDDGTQCHGSILKPVKTGFDLQAFLAEPKATPLPGDPYDGDPVALRYFYKSWSKKMDVKAYGDRKGPPAALKYIIAESDAERSGSSCKYKSDSGGRMTLSRTAIDKVVTIYDRTTGDVVKTMTVAAKMPRCYSETHKAENISNSVDSDKVDKRVERWVERNL